MERGVNVNDWPANEGDANSEELFPIAPSTPTTQDLGPCLYLGPAGQRCSRRAVNDGFCAIHQPGQSGQSRVAVRPPAAKRSRVVAAILGILGVLWPLLADLVREITRWLHSH
jgi:hypothetical protein